MKVHADSYRGFASPNLQPLATAGVSIEFASTAIRDFIRSRNTRDDNLILSNELVETYADEHTPETDYARKELFEHLVRHISTLREGDQEIIYLYNDGLTYKEIAERVGLTPKQIDHKLQRIKQYLRDHTEGLR